jgi:hypothetical protein
MGLLLSGALCACADGPQLGAAGTPTADDHFRLDAAYEAAALQESASAQSPWALSPDPADPHDFWLSLGESPDGNIERYYSKISGKAIETARAQAEQHAAVEEMANKAADAAQARADEARKAIGTAAPDPDDSAELTAERAKAMLAAFDVLTALEVKAARQKVIDDARKASRYVDSSKTDADLKTARNALNGAVDAIYSDGISQAVEKLNAEYELPGNPRRASAETQSGYEGEYYKLDRVDRYFKENWAGDNQASTTENCKSALGFHKDGDNTVLKDPTADNVDNFCGIRQGLISLLVSYKGTKKPAEAQNTAEASGNP